MLLYTTLPVLIAVTDQRSGSTCCTTQRAPGEAAARRCPVPGWEAQHCRVIEKLGHVSLRYGGWVRVVRVKVGHAGHLHAPHHANTEGAFGTTRGWVEVTRNPCTIQKEPTARVGPTTERNHRLRSRRSRERQAHPGVLRARQLSDGTPRGVISASDARGRQVARPKFKGATEQRDGW